MGEDIRKLDHGFHVLSGSPGRVCDMIKKRTLRTRPIKLLVLVNAGPLPFYHYNQKGVQFSFQTDVFSLF